MKITYTQKGEYLIPDLTLPEQQEFPIGKYGRMRLSYLKTHRKGVYTALLTSCRLNQHLVEIDSNAIDMLESLMKQMALDQGITEQLKAENQLLWVGKMNNIKACAEEIVLNQIVYA